MKKKSKELWIPSAEEVAEERERLSSHREFRRVLRSTLYVVTAAVAIAVLLATLLLPVMQITGASMEPTLDNGEVVLLWRTDQFTTGDLCGFYYQNKILIKRVIGVPGDWVNIDGNGRVYVNDVLLDEPYVSSYSLGECDIQFPYQVPDNKFFVLGDHRDVSIDSRSTTVGCVDKDMIVGRVILRVWPLSKISVFG